MGLSIVVSTRGAPCRLQTVNRLWEVGPVLVMCISAMASFLRVGSPCTLSWISCYRHNGRWYHVFFLCALLYLVPSWQSHGCVEAFRFLILFLLALISELPFWFSLYKH